jgi:hypothetical protein
MKMGPTYRTGAKRLLDPEQYRATESSRFAPVLTQHIFIRGGIEDSRLLLQKSTGDTRHPMAFSLGNPLKNGITVEGMSG